MKFGQILVCCMANISDMFLVECWRLEANTSHFIKMPIQAFSGEACDCMSTHAQKCLDV